MTWKKDFASDSYSRLPLNEVLKLYESREIPSDLILARLQNLNQWFNLFVGGWGAHVNPSKLEKVREFEKDYGKELDFIYSNHLLNGMYVMQRLRDPGKFRIAEPLLMAKYKALPLEELFNSEYLNSEDRERLTVAQDENGNYLLPKEIVEERVKKLPDRIKGLQKLMQDARELSKEGHDKPVDYDKLYSRLKDLIYEKNTFRGYLEKRKI